MSFHKISVLAACIAAAIAFSGCTPSSETQSQASTDAQIRKIAASLPRKIDAATTVVEVRGDEHGGMVTVSTVDTSMVKIPSQEKLKEILCGVRSDSPPAGNHNPFTGITYIYTDLQGRELTRVHFGRGECPGQAM